MCVLTLCIRYTVYRRVYRTVYGIKIKILVFDLHVFLFFVVLGSSHKGDNTCVCRSDPTTTPACLLPPHLPLHYTDLPIQSDSSGKHPVGLPYSHLTIRSRVHPCHILT